MKHAFIAGLGIQGVAIAYGMHVLGYEVSGIDISGTNVESAISNLGKLGVSLDARKGDFRSFLPDNKPDIVISALPFRLNRELAAESIENDLRYCDLGGNIDTSDAINYLARESESLPVMTDLGLAPGIANIIAEIGYRKIGTADTVKIRVGGLPVNPTGILKYGLTFSPDGLYNEYREDCHVLRDGEKYTVESITDIENITFDETGGMEAFNTSGGISNTLDSMLARGVRNCDYKTIRFPGHARLIRFMLFECGMTRDTFSEAVLNACGFITKDQVLMYIEVSDSTSGNSWTIKNRILHDDIFTAMQKTTGFGAAAVAAIIGSGSLDGKSTLHYEDIPTGEFSANLGKLIPEIEL